MHHYHNETKMWQVAMKNFKLHMTLPNQGKAGNPWSFVLNLLIHSSLKPSLSFKGFNSSILNGEIRKVCHRSSL